MKLAMYSALPCYFGAKRRLNAQIFKHVPLPSVAPTFIDCFLGGGSVSLFAKARGHRVLCNDLADRSVIVGNAIIVNGRQKLSEADVMPALMRELTDAESFTQRSYCPDYFLPLHAKTVDQLLAHARASKCPIRRDLIRVLTIQYITRWRPFGDFHQAGMNQRLADFDVNDANMNLVAVTKIKGLFDKTSIDRIRILLKDINGGIFDNGQRNEVHQLDAAEYVRSVAGDVLYMDPPYFGSNAYEKVYGVLDTILAGSESGEREVSKFNTKSAVDALDELFEAGSHIPHWVISFGGGKLSTDEFLAMVRKHRPNATSHPISCKYYFGSAGGRDAAGKEILITASHDDSVTVSLSTPTPKPTRAIALTIPQE